MKIFDKGDGALFLALMVIHCNNILTSIPIWKGNLSEWWGIKGVCSIQNACTLQENGETLISNKYFLKWAFDIVTQNEGNTGGGFKRKLNKKSDKRKTNKRKSNKRKSNKRKSNKRKSNKRKSNKKFK